MFSVGPGKLQKHVVYTQLVPWKLGVGHRTLKKPVICGYGASRRLEKLESLGLGSSKTT